MRRALLLMGTMAFLVGCATSSPPPVASSRHTSFDCGALIPAMLEVYQATRETVRLTPAQEETWHLWNAQCKDPLWQKTLALRSNPSAYPDMLIDPVATKAAVPPPPSLTWRDYLKAAGEGIQRGLDAPITTCRTSTTHGRNGSGLVTNCTTW